MNRSNLAEVFDLLNIETQFRIIRGAAAAKKTVEDFMVSLLSESVNTNPFFLLGGGVNT